MKIAFFIPNMRGGGAERVLQNLLNQMIVTYPHFHIHLILAKKEGVLLSGLNSKIKIIDCNKLHVKSCLFYLIKYFNVEKPDYFVSTLDYVNITVSFVHKLTRSKSKLLLWEHNTLSIHSKITISKYDFLNKILIKYFYSQAYRIVVVSKGIKDDLISKYNLSEKNISVIYNPVYNDSIIQYSNTKDKDTNVINIPYIVTVGRLVKQKNYFNLITAFKILLESKIINNINLVIIGEGKEKNNIIELINQLKINNYVYLTGFLRNPFPIIKNSIAVVLASDWEGLPTILIEALSLKKQIVSTDCPSGPREILDHGKYGLLVPVNNPEKLAEGIAQIIKGKVKFDEELLLQRAKYFNIEKSFNQFMEVIN